jgi:mannan endo-1,4-beta-mannosidase
MTCFTAKTGASRTAAIQKAVCGDYPALLGAEIGGIELGKPISIDSVPFDLIRKKAIEQYGRGGVVTISWHMDNPVTGGNAWDTSDSSTVHKILNDSACEAALDANLDIAAKFLSSIRTKEGTPVPILFRPWHEMNYDWFWWGEKFCSDSEYVALYRKTVDRFRSKGLDNILFVYSPSQGFEPEDYESRYPGDDYVDVLAFDAYMYGTKEEFISMVRKELGIIRDMAGKHGKPFAISETGYESIPDPNWWTGTLAPAIKGTGASYVLTWRNAWNKPEHYFSTFAGEKSASDFIDFYNLPETVFAGDLEK